MANAAARRAPIAAPECHDDKSHLAGRLHARAEQLGAMLIHRRWPLHAHTRNGDHVPDDRLGADPRAREGSQSADGTGEHTAGNQSGVHC